jgi:ketosteroid isomerase-like protein
MQPKLMPSCPKTRSVMVSRTGVKYRLDARTALVERWFAAWDERDVDELLRIAHPDIEVVPENPLLDRLPGTSFRGRVGLRTLALLSFEDYPRLRSSRARSETSEVWSPGRRRSSWTRPRRP